MVEVVLALAAIAVTAAIVIGDARPPSRQPPAPPKPPALEETGSALLSTEIDLPTQTFDPAALTVASMPAPQTVLTLPSSSSEIVPSSADAPLEAPRWQPDPERLIQTEVVIPDGAGQHRTAVVRLAIGITASGLVLGLGIMGVARAIGALVRAL